MDRNQLQKFQEDLNKFEFDNSPRIHRKISTGKSGAEVYIVQIIKKENGRKFKLPSLIKVTSLEEGIKEVEAHRQAIQLAEQNEMEKFIPTIIQTKKFENMQATMYEFASASTSFTLNEAISKQMALDYEKILNEILHFSYNWDFEMNVNMCPYEAIINTLGEEKWQDLISAIKELGVDTNKKLLSLDGGRLFPNPLVYLYNKNLWNETNLDIYLSYAHGDFHGNNIIVKDKSKVELAIIDFAEMKEDINTFYDNRYLELHLLLDCYPLDALNNQDKWMKICEYLTRDLLRDNTYEIPDGIAPFDKIIPYFGRSYIEVFDDDCLFMQDYLPSYYLAGVCAGLIYARRRKLDKVKRFAALTYALFNFKELMTCLQIKIPNEESLPLKWPIDQDKQELLEILEKEQFRLYAQPIVNIRTGKVEFVEIFTRFNSKYPDEWFKIARKNDLLDRLTILSCQRLVKDSCHLKNLNLIGVFFNLEADLAESTIRECIRILKECSIPVIIEITEYSKKNPQMWKKICEEEQISIAIDDFGDETATDIDEIKILQPEFVKMKIENVDSYYSSIHNIDREYIRKLIVEKVEEKSELVRLSEDGIKYVQGWIFSIPHEIVNSPIEEWNKGFLHIIKGL